MTGALPQFAHAVVVNSAVISDQQSCENIEGRWIPSNDSDPYDYCVVENMYVNSGATVRVSNVGSGEIVLVLRGASSNYGVIDYEGKLLVNAKYFTNFGSINNVEFTNYGTMNNADGEMIVASLANYGYITNGGLIKSDKIENIVARDESGQPLQQINPPWIHNGGTIEVTGVLENESALLNEGIIINKGTMQNIGDGTITNSDMIQNDGQIINNEGTFENDGTIENGCNGSIEGKTIEGSVQNPCDSSASTKEQTPVSGEEQTRSAQEMQESQTPQQSGCLIATATYGSEFSPQVQMLREIRDNQLLKTSSGAGFMTTFNSVYYSFSPQVADYERQNPLFKEAVKVAITPLISTLSILTYVSMDSEAEAVGYGIGVILLNIGIYFVAPAFVIMLFRSRRNKQ